MENNFVGAVLFFIIGAAICFVNYKLSDYFLKKHKKIFSAVSLIRQALQVGYIALLFFTADYTPWNKTYVLIGGVLGVTLPMLITTYRLLLTNKSEAETEKKGDDADG